MEKVILSTLKESDFSMAVSLIYSFTKYNEKQYPGYYKWFYEKNIPRIIKGNGDIFFFKDNEKIVAVSVVKKDKEKKICTFFVDSKYRGLGLGRKLLKESFDYLETTKPLITIPVSKIHFFEDIIKKYSWKSNGLISEYNELEEVFNK